MKSKYYFILSIIVLVNFLLLPVGFAVTDEEFSRGTPPWDIEEVPTTLLPILKAYFPQDLIPSQANSGTCYDWEYMFVDFDGTGASNYLLIFYEGYGGSKLKILKQENNTYQLLWEKWTPELDSGVNTFFELLDINNDGKPEIKISQHSFGGNPVTYNEQILQWNVVEGEFITPADLLWQSNYEYIDVNRDGLLDIVSWNPFAEKGKIYLFDGYNYTLDKEIPIEDARCFVLTTVAKISPVRWYLGWVNSHQQENIKTILYGLESHAVTEIVPASVRLEDRVKPIRTWTEDNKFIAEFDKQAVMQYLIKTPRLKPLAAGDKIDITVSALLTTGQYVSGTSAIEIAEEQKSIPFSQFSLKHWRITWDQGKHDKNKFQISGRIDLPDDYTLDMLQKKGIVSIAIEKKDSAPFSQTAILDFKQHGPIWHYKAPKAQNGTEPLDIEKMLIFWQPEGLEDKPDKQGHAGKGHGKRKRAGWFMIQGNINISDTNQAALLPKAALTLNIPVENITTTGALESREEIEFKVHKNLWSYNAASHNRWQNWQENWWEKVKED